MRAMGRGLFYNSPMAMAMPNLTNIKKVSVSDLMPTYFSGDTCALSNDGIVSCWGDNDDVRQNSMPTAIGGLPIIRDIMMNRDTLYALDETGNLLSRVNNALTQVNTITQIDSGVLELSNTGECYIKVNGDVGCFGTSPGVSAYSVQSGGDSFVQVSNLCALRASGKVGCWQESDTSASNVVLWENSAFLDLQGVTEIGGDCALHSDGKVECWSYSSSATTNKYRLDISPALIDITKLVDTSVNSVCGLNNLGDLKCYGVNDANPSGIYGTSIPVAYEFTGEFTLQNGLPAGSIKSASLHGTGACAVLQDNTVACWGENLHGLLSEAPNGMHTSFLEQPILNDTWLGIYDEPL